MMVFHSTIKMRVVLGDYDDSALSVSFKTQPVGERLTSLQKTDMKRQLRNLVRKAYETLEEMWQ